MLKQSFLKNWVFVMTLFAGFTFTGCEKENKEKGGDIVGIWEYTGARIVEVDWVIQMSATQKKQVEDAFIADLGELFGVMECTSNGKMDYGAGYYQNTYKLDGNKITIYEDGDTFYGTYSVKGNTLQLDLDFVKSDPDLKEYCRTLVVGLTFTRIGDSLRSGAAAKTPTAITDKGFLKSVARSPFKGVEK